MNSINERRLIQKKEKRDADNNKWKVVIKEMWEWKGKRLKSFEMLSLLKAPIHCDVMKVKRKETKNQRKKRKETNIIKERTGRRVRGPQNRRELKEKSIPTGQSGSNVLVLLWNEYDCSFQHLASTSNSCSVTVSSLHRVFYNRTTDFW